MPPAPSVALVIHALNSGGAERVLAGLANHWAQAAVEVTLITLADAGSDAYPLHPAVRRVGLDLLRPSESVWQALRNNAIRIRRLRRAICDSRATRVVSFTDNMNVLTLLACRGGSWRVVIAERSDPRWQRMGRCWEWLRRRSYPRCAAAVVQTEGVAAHVRRLVCGKPVYVIPNAVWQPPPGGTPAGAELPRGPYVVAMGRLTEEKGFDRLIEAFSQVAAGHPDWQLQILGAGPLRAPLEDLARLRNVQQRVNFAGWHPDPQPILQRAALFVLASRWEGFPNALLEAMACGLPAISFDCDSGPREIIRHEVDGLLVPPGDVRALAAALDRLMGDEPLRRRLGAAARQVVQRFDGERFFARWDAAVGLEAASEATTAYR